MKRLLLIILSLCFAVMLQAVSVVNTAGNLANSGFNLNMIINLTVTGTIDARDFKTMRDSMPLLQNVNLSGATIVAYTGTAGTLSLDTTYVANGVPQQAFYDINISTGKTSLTSVTIPSSVIYIGYKAFSGCTGLTSLIIPPLVTHIEHYAFQNCIGLISISFPSSVTSIGDFVFSDCSSLTSVTISENMSSIGSYAFYNCTGLTSINIPSSVYGIGNNAFEKCSGLITVDASNPNYSSVDGVLYNKAQTTLRQCPTSKTGSYTIPSTVTSIGYSSFSGCTGLTSVTIPSSVTSIGWQAFENCSGLTSIYAYKTVPVDLSYLYKAFNNVDTTTCVLHVPVGSLAAYDAAVQWTDFLNIVEDLPTDLDTPVVNKVKVSTSKGQTIISGIPIGETITIYTLQGTPIYNQQANTETVTVNLPTRGVYIVKVGEQCVKVVN